MSRARCGGIGRSTDTGTGRSAARPVPPGTGTSGYGVVNPYPPTWYHRWPPGDRAAAWEGSARVGRIGQRAPSGAREGRQSSEAEGRGNRCSRRGSSRRRRVRVTAVVLAQVAIPVREPAWPRVRLGGRPVSGSVCHAAAVRGAHGRTHGRAHCGPTSRTDAEPTRPTPAPTPDPTPAPTPDPTAAPTPDPTPAPDRRRPRPRASPTSSPSRAASMAPPRTRSWPARARPRRDRSRCSGCARSCFRRPRHRRRGRPPRRRAASSASTPTASARPRPRPNDTSYRRPVVAAEDRLGPGLRHRHAVGQRGRRRARHGRRWLACRTWPASSSPGPRSSTAPPAPPTRTATAPPWPGSSPPGPTTAAASPASASPASRSCPSPSSTADGLGQDSDIIAGVVWAVDHGADVINMASATPATRAALQAAIGSKGSPPIPNYIDVHGAAGQAEDAAGGDLTPCLRLRLRRLGGPSARRLSRCGVLTEEIG